jgi:hypothetical protein
MTDTKLLDLEKQIIEKDKEINRMTARSLKVYQKNEMLVSDPLITAKRSEMIYQLELSDKFIKSGAFPNMSPEQAFTIIKAGQEMGMSAMESLNTLYIVKGSIQPYGKGMIAIMTKNGWTVSYQDEDVRGVTVVAEKDGVLISERVTDKDQIIMKSNAAKFALKNKMRFHGARMILNFHLPHLIQSTSDLFEGEFHKYEDMKIEETKTVHSQIFEEE